MDLNQLIGEPLGITETATGRVYVTIGKHLKTGVALKCNLGLQPVMIKDPLLGMTQGVVVILRFAEDKTPDSPSFNLKARAGEQEQNPGDTHSLYRYQPHAWPMCLLGPNAYVIRRWNEQSVTAMLRLYLKTLVEAAGAKLVIDDAGLTSLLTSWQDEHPSADPDYFLQSFHPNAA